VVAAVKDELPPIPGHLSQHNTRGNRLLLGALQEVFPVVEKTLADTPPHRVAIVVGTSNSGIREGELALAHHRRHGAFPPAYHYAQQELGSPSMFLADFLRTRGPAYTISTACTSSARAFISAKRLLAADLADVVIVGGADSLCRMTLGGFDSLSALSRGGCRPFAAGRDGITIGEAAAVFILGKSPAPIRLAGFGESSDAHHMSAPDPTGAGAEAAIRQAAQSAGVGEAGEVAYVNLHGTGTPLNDSMEAAAIHRVFGDRVPCSSTKHLTGHTLGTCGALEADIACTLLENPGLPLPNQQLTADSTDPALPDIHLLRADASEHLRGKKILSTNFAFCGNNTALLFSTE
ncbi:MAG: beta-ketoacyl-ACP synthase, partial [Puniceicoccales bacterium]|jgi:3-oxoacyl-[acyl-carrier-protein] synthase-1|nr:beta-ketoacyl-ACP synthase [Puniceicoccales bacterium]